MKRRSRSQANAAILFNPARITPPFLSSVLQRPHLMERLDRNRDKPFIFMIGQAAQGKTTLAALWCSASGRPTAWINLHPEDSDAATLYLVLLQSLQKALPDADFEGLRDLPGLGMGPRERRFTYLDWINALMGRIHGPVEVVLDGLDRLDPDAPAFLFIRLFLESVVPGMRVFLLSRELPPLDVPQLVVRQAAHILGNKEIALTPEETAIFIRKNLKIRMSEQGVRQIHSIVEGWVGAVILLSEVVGRASGVPVETSTIENLQIRLKAEVFQYFSEQIFQSQPEHVQDFLMRSSLPDFLDVDLLRSLFPGDDAVTTLEELVRKNLFIQTLSDDEGRITYRYYQLFRDYLLDRFRMTVPLEEQRGSYRMTAAFLAARGERAAAVRFYLTAGEYLLASRIMEGYGMVMMQTGQTDELSRWLAACPRDIVAGNPWLLLYDYLTKRFVAGRAVSSKLHRAMLLFEERGDLRGMQLATAYLIEGYFYGSFYEIPQAELLTKGEALLRNTGKDRRVLSQAHLWLQLAVGHAMGIGGPRESLRAHEQAQLAAVRAGIPYLLIQSLVQSIWPLCIVGDFPRCRERLNKAEKLLARQDYPEVRTMLHCGWAMYYVYEEARGTLSKAAAAIQTALELADRHGIPFLFPILKSHEMYIKTEQGLYDEAAEIGNTMRKLHESMDSPMPLGLTLWALGRNAYYQGDFDAACGFLQEAISILSSPRGFASFHLAVTRVLMALIHLHKENLDRAEKELQTARSFYSENGSDTAMSDCHYAMALLRWRQGRREEAGEHLAAAFRVISSKEIVGFSTLREHDLARICAIATEMKIPGGADCIVRVMLAHCSPAAFSELERLRVHEDEEVRRRALEICRRLHRAGRPAIRIETLGRFCVSIGGTPISESCWGGSMPKQLLKALIARGAAAGVPRERIMEDLWPETARHTGEQNFKVILHRLRRALEPDAESSLGFSYIHLKDNVLFLDGELCRTDMDEFCSLCDAGRRAERCGKAREAIAAYGEAAEIYRGDFIPDDLYSAWAMERRESLQRQYREILVRTAGLYEGLGRLKKAIACHLRILESDSLLEDSYQKLILLYSRCGMHNDARKVYRKCRKALLEELGTEPNESIQTLYKKLLETSREPA